MTINLDILARAAESIAHVSGDATFTTHKVPADGITINGEKATSAYKVTDSYGRDVGAVVQVMGEWYAVCHGTVSLHRLTSRTEALGVLRFLWIAYLTSTTSVTVAGI